MLGLVCVLSMATLAPVRAVDQGTLVISAGDVTVDRSDVGKGFYANVDFGGTGSAPDGDLTIDFVAVSVEEFTEYELCSIDTSSIVPDPTTSAFGARVRCAMTPSDLPSGYYDVYATMSLGTQSAQSDSTSMLTVEDTSPVRILAQLQVDRIFPFHDGYRDNTSAQLTVEGKNSQGLRTPVSGIVRVAGSKSYRFQSSGVAHVTLQTKGLSFGEHAVEITVNRGGALSDLVKRLSLSIKPTVAQQAHLGRSDSTVFPSRDGFKDTVSLYPSSTTSIGKAVPGTGTLNITAASGKVVKHWTLHSSRQQSLNWDGRTTQGVVPGDYLATYRFKGPEGEAVSAVQHISVKATAAQQGRLIESDAKVFPSHDGYKDTVVLYASSTTSIGRPVAGTGSLNITTPSGKLVKHWTLHSSRQQSFSWNGRTSQGVVPGVYLATYRFKGVEGQAVRAIQRITVRPEHLEKRIVTHTYGAWDAIDDCALGDSFDPCGRGNLDGNSLGIHLYSSGDGDTMLAGGSLSLPQGTSRWRLTFNGVTVGWTAPRFGYVTTDSSWSPVSQLKRFPSIGSWQGEFQTNWYTTPGPWAYFVIGSIDWGYLYLTTVTVEAEVPTLVK